MSSLVLYSRIDLAAAVSQAVSTKSFPTIPKSVSIFFNKRTKRAIETMMTIPGDEEEEVFFLLVKERRDLGCGKTKKKRRKRRKRSVLFFTTPATQNKNYLKKGNKYFA